MMAMKIPEMEINLIDKVDMANKYKVDECKGRSLISDLVTCYFKNAQREWMKLSCRRSRGQKYRILKRCANDFSQRRRIKVT